MRYYYGDYIKGKLKSNDGRFVIYDDKVIVAYSLKMDFDYLLNSLVSKYKFPKTKVFKEGIRLYYTHEEERIVISPVRKIDDKMMLKDWEKNRTLIKSNLL